MGVEPLTVTPRWANSSDGHWENAALSLARTCPTNGSQPGLSVGTFHSNTGVQTALGSLIPGMVERHARGGTCCPCWDPSCCCDLSYRRQTRATSAWPPGSPWGCATLATSSPSRMSSRCVAVSTGDMRLGCGMSGHDCAPSGKKSNGHVMLAALDTGRAQAACVAALCWPCASQRGTRCPQAVGLGAQPLACHMG